MQARKEWHNIFKILGRKAMTNIDSILKSRDTTLPTKVHILKVMVFPVDMNGCESWSGWGNALEASKDKRCPLSFWKLKMLVTGEPRKHRDGTPSSLLVQVGKESVNSKPLHWGLLLCNCFSLPSTFLPQHSHKVTKSLPAGLKRRMELGQSERQSAPMESDTEVCFQSLSVTALPQILTRLTLSYLCSSMCHSNTSPGKSSRN